MEAVAKVGSEAPWEHENIQLYVPLTVIVNDRIALHANGGGVWERNDRNAAIWGVAADLNLNLLGESYGSHRGDTAYQIGLRMGLGAGFADLSYGWTE